MARQRKIGGQVFDLLRFAKTKKRAEKIVSVERKGGSQARILKGALEYKGYPYSIWVRD